MKNSKNKNKQVCELENLLIKKMPTGCILWGADFRAELWNPAAEKMFGYSAKEALGKHCYDLIVPKSVRRETDKVWKTLLKKGETVNNINENYTKSGKKIICDWTNSPIKRSDGSVVGVLSIVSEITEKHKYEKNLLESQRRLADVIDFLPDATFVLDLHSRVTAWNKAIEKMSKMKAKDVLGKGNYIYALPFYGKRRPVLADLVLQPKLWKQVNKTGGYAAISKEGDIFTTERFLENVGGKNIFVWAKAAPLYDSNGKLSGVVESVRDITKEKELDRAKTEFISMASHQLRTPLSTIKWTLNSFDEKDKLNRKNQDRLQDVYESNERLISLVNNLLNITRIESGRMVVRRKRFALLRAIRDAGKTCQKQALIKKQKVSYVIRGKIKEVFADPTTISEAFCNILNNAIIYGFTKSKIKVTIKREKGNYLVAIHNFGPIIAKTDREKVFSKFYRGTGSPIRNFAGNGLGLFFTKATIEANGGKIWFDSQRGKGTTFYFTVPIK